VVDIAAGRGAQEQRSNVADAAFKFATWFFAFLVLVLLGAVIVALIDGSLLALQRFGLAFVWTETWNPVRQIFGARAPMIGTLITSAIAMLVGIPISFGIAVFLTQLCPVWARRPLSVGIELLAGIPSIIYGIWGLFVFAPYMQSYVEPFLMDTVAKLPVVGPLFDGPPLGIGMLTAGIILGIMVLPFISSIMRDVFDTVPPMLKESAYGLGCTTWEVMWNVVLPYTRIGVVGGIMLGLGRALGETMAVTFVIGNAHHLSVSLLAPGTTISAALANEFTEAVEDIYQSSLVALGLILFVITLIVLSVAKYMLIRLQSRAGT